VTRLVGHALWHEGAPYDDRGRRIEYPRTTEGRAKCECGELSEALPSGAARRRWHADHKADVSSR